MNFWAKLLLQVLTAVPAAVQGVEVLIDGAKKGADKKTLALASLGLAEGVSKTVAPEYQKHIEIATQLASNAIDSTVAIMNLVKSQQTPTPVTAPSETVTAQPQAASAAAGTSDNVDTVSRSH